MNQQQFIKEGKDKLPIAILKWIWKNLDKIDDVIEFLMTVRGIVSKREETEPECGGKAKPTGSPTPNGYWSCIGGNWVWIEDIG